MSNKIYVMGHRNPDTDSICSAIAYADFKNKKGIDAEAVRLGEINRETQFVLDYFGVPSPIMLDTTKTQVSDLSMDKITPVTADISIKTAWTIMKKNNIKALPIVDANEHLMGIVTLSDITGRYMDAWENNSIVSSRTPLKNIVETLNGELICGTQEDFRTSGKVVIATLSPDELTSFIDEGDIVIVGNKESNLLKAIELGANCLVITCGGKVSPEVLELAREKKCVLIITMADTFTTARLINQSIPIGFTMTKDNLVYFRLDDFVDDIKDKMLQTRFRSYPVMDDYSKVKGFISRYHLISQKRKRVILLDHNEKSQTIKGIEQAEILEIIDHHRVGDIQTGNPVFFRNEPVGCTSTIIANIYWENGIRPSKSMAGLMCAAIISDTMNFKSPTKTHQDVLMAERLAEIANINISDFAKEMFKAGSSIENMSTEDILYNDFKEYFFDKYKIGIGQINTIAELDNGQSMDKVKQDILSYMNEVCNNKGYSLLMLMLTDIFTECTDVLFVGSEKWIFAKAFNVGADKQIAQLEDTVSRKQQIIPRLAMAIQQI